MRGFLRTFRAVDTLDLSYCGLTELPLDPEALAKLENLNLNNNPLTRIDVGDGTSLKSLDLSNTALSQWPAGAEDLPNLTWLDLGDTRLSTLPDVLLANDRLVLATNLNAVPLTEQAKMDLALARQRIERGLGLFDGALQRFALEASRNHTPPEESGSVVAQRLLPLPPVPEGKGAAVWPRRIQRLCPEFDDARAQTTLRRMQEAGLSGVQISARIEQWERVFDALTRRLNGWVFTHETRGMDWVVSSRTRQLAAQRILDCWRRGAIDWNGVADLELDLDGLQVGDLPELPEAMPAVSNLNLAGVRLSASGSNGFLEAFSRLRRLDLTGNHLLSIPEPVAQMQQLEQLRLAFTGLDEASSLYPTLERLTRLQSLNLSHNNLRDFNVTRLLRLEQLNLRSNLLTDWPEGALQARHLHSLDLSNNDITSIPVELFYDSHATLLAGTRLEENQALSQESLHQLRDYSDAHGRNEVLGLTYTDIDLMIDDLSTTTGSTDDSVWTESEPEADEVLEPPVESELDEQVTPWIANIPHDEVRRCGSAWSASPTMQRFFTCCRGCRTLKSSGFSVLT
jgi:Leucine-rich repeat (LRR) protein